jgi:hypothetical protein
MKKNNNKASRSKVKRANKNKKRLSNKVQLSKFERQQINLYEKIRGLTYANILQNKKENADESRNS